MLRPAWLRKGSLVSWNVFPLSIICLRFLLLSLASLPLICSRGSYSLSKLFYHLVFCSFLTLVCVFVNKLIIFVLSFFFGVHLCIFFIDSFLIWFRSIVPHITVSPFLSLLRRSERSLLKESVLSLKGSHLTASAKSSVFGILLFVCVTWDEFSKRNNESFEWRHCFCRVGCQSSAAPSARRHENTSRTQQVCSRAQDIHLRPAWAGHSPILSWCLLN